MDENPYPTDAQNAIFNFLFVLVSQYSMTMEPVAAIHKACDWLITLGQTIKDRANELDIETQDKFKLFD